MKRLARVLLIALSAAFANHAGAAQTVGVVLLHGKTGTPDQMAKLGAALTAAGYAVEAPEMCWSRTRIFDKAFADCLGEVDAAVARLKAAGATRIVVGGISQGAVAAIAYGATHRGLAGIIAMAPAADPVDTTSYPGFAEGLKSAFALAKAGKGDTITELDDIVSGGKDVMIKTTPKIYLSFHGPDSPIATIRNLTAKSLPKLSTPLLWVAGTKDPSQANGPKAFAAAPGSALSQYATVPANHAGTADAAASVVVAWLGAVAGK